MKHPAPPIANRKIRWSWPALVWVGMMAICGHAQQFNRIGSVMTVAEVYTSAAAAQLGGAANLQVDMNNNVAAANVAMQNSGTGMWVENVGYLEASESDPGTLHSLLGQFWTWPDVASFWSSTGAGIIQCVGIGTDDAGLSYECGSEGTVSAVYLSANVFAHELGRNNCCEQGDGFGGNGLVTLMLFNYCGGNNILYFSNPGAYYNGIQLLGNTNEDCSQGPLANEGNNARQFTLNGPNYQGSKPVLVDSLGVFNPVLTAVHCGGAAVATLSADQRTFAADQNYSGGTAWDANGYDYTVDLSGVTNPAPQAVYQDQRYGNCSYTFDHYLPGTNYLVRLHAMECCWSAVGQREFNVFINGRQALTNFDIFAAAGGQNRAVIKEIMTTANAAGQVVVGFSNVVDNASISGIEILQGGLYTPLNLSAMAISSQVWLTWDAVPGATSYNVKRATVSGGPYTTIANSPSPSYEDTGTAGGATYYYVVSAVNSGNESFNSFEASSTTTANTVDTWLGGAGNDFGVAANWSYSKGAGPVASGDALAFGSVGPVSLLNNETGFDFASISFNPGAQGYSISGNPFLLGTATGGLVLFDDCTNPESISDNITLGNGPQTILAATGSLTLSGGVSASSDLDKSGQGELRISGALSLSAGNLNLDAGTLDMTNTGSLAAGSSSSLQIGVANGRCAALYQWPGTSINVANTALGGFQIGSAPFASGYFNLSGGNLAVGGEIDTGGSGGGAGTFGQLDMSGGVLTLPNNSSTYFLPNRGGPGESSVVNISGGTVQISGGGLPTDDNINGLSINWGGSQTNTTTLSGSGQFLTPSLRVKLNQGTDYAGLGDGGASDVTTLNLNGGALQTLGFLNGPAANNPGVNINFNGGTLMAGIADNSSFLTNLAGAWIYQGGAIINDNGHAITIGQPLLAPPGNGIQSIAVRQGGAGYVTPPQVVIAGGGGAGATASAVISGGTVTAIQVTCPGSGFIAAPAVFLNGGGSTTAALAGTVTLSANASGGLTKLGAGTLTLAQADTFTGDTLLESGKLALSGVGSLASSNIVVNRGATLDVTGSTPAYTLAAGQSLFGSGTVNGALIAGPGAGIHAGPGAGYATNTFTGNLTFAAGSLAYLNLGQSHIGSNDLFSIGGTLTLDGTVIQLKAPGAGAALDTAGDYVLMTAGSLAGNPNATPTWDVVPANATHYYVVINGNTLALHYSTTGLTPPGGTGAVSPGVATRNQAVYFSVAQTSGNAAVTNIVLNASLIGGPASLPLVQSNSTAVFTNSASVSGGTVPGVKSLVVTMTDANHLGGTVTLNLTVVATNQTWDGGSMVDNNWSSNPNWSSGAGPGLVGDGVTFAGSTRLAPNLNENYSVTGMVFGADAGSFIIGSSDGSALTLANGGAVVNNSTNVQTLDVPLADGGAGITKSGSGLVVFGANNPYSGPTTVSAGTLEISGHVASTNITTVANVAGNACLVDSGSISQPILFVGNANGAAGAVYQTSGSMSVSPATTFDNTAIGNVAGSFGYYDALGGVFTSVGIAVGGENNNGSGFSGTGGNGILEVTGGTVNDTGWLVMARGVTGETGLLNIFGGSLTYAGGGIVNCWGGGQTAVINVLGGVVSNAAAAGFDLNQSGNSNNTGILNLDGGVAMGDWVSGAYGQVNFDGGILQSGTSNGSFLTGLGSVNVYPGGATINDNGYTIGINQALLSPAGKGIQGIASFTPGAGYIAPPIVTVVRGAGDTTGEGATAIAQIDDSTGKPTSGEVTNILITCAGVNYTATPLFVLSGGGGTTPATITGQAPVPNASGGLVKAGAGLLTLGGYSTYEGATTVSNGTLRLADPVLHLTFDNVNGSTVINEGSGGSSMNGTLTGAATIVSGGRFGNALSIPSGAANAGYVLVNNPVVGMTGGNGWTIAMWVKTGTAGGVYAYQGSGGWASGNMTFYLNEGSDAGYGAKAGGVSYAQGWEEGSTSINDGNWHFLAMTCNGSTKAMYVDGKVDAIASSWAADTGVGDQFWVGGSPDTGDQDIGLNGLIDEVYVFNSALSQAQVQSLYGRNSTGMPVLPAATAVTVASGAVLDINGLSQAIGSLSGTGNLVLGDDAAAVGNLTLGDANSTVFGGVISDSGLESVTKVGAGTLTVTRANSYRGSTTVSNGTFLVDGSTGGGNVTVANGATLGGGGLIGGTVTIQSGGTLSPGPSAGAIGTLTLSNTPVLNGMTLMKINRNGGACLNDRIALTSGTFTGGGVLEVTNLGAPLQAGDAFQLFSATTYGGSFAAANLPALGSHLYWTNTLAQNGKITVASLISLAATNLSWTVSGTNLNLFWPSDHIGWRLLMQTNHLNLGLSVNPADWTTVGFSQTTNQVYVPINDLSPAAFYRLVYP